MSRLPPQRRAELRLMQEDSLDSDAARRGLDRLLSAMGAVILAIAVSALSLLG